MKRALYYLQDPTIAVKRQLETLFVFFVAEIVSWVSYTKQAQRAKNQCIHGKQ